MSAKKKVERSKLREWLDEKNPTTLRGFAKAMKISPGYVCQLARSVNAPWPSKEIAQRLFRQTNGFVTPNDLAEIVAPTGDSFDPGRSIQAGK